MARKHTDPEVAAMQEAAWAVNKIEVAAGRSLAFIEAAVVPLDAEAAVRVRRFAMAKIQSMNHRVVGMVAGIGEDGMPHPPEPEVTA